jgi:hypothetical protein
VKQMGIKIGLPDARARDYVIAVFICQVWFHLRYALRRCGYHFTCWCILLRFINCSLDVYIAPYWMIVEHEMEKSWSRALLR